MSQEKLINMNIEIKHNLGHGFSIEGVVNKQVFTPEQAQTILGKFYRLEEIGDVANGFHFYSSMFLKTLEETKKQYNELGHRIKLYSSIPASVTRFSTYKRPQFQVYRINNGIFFKGRSTLDLTVPYKLSDIMETEIKTIFNVSYTLDFTDKDKPLIKRVENADTRRVDDLVGLLRDLNYPALTKQSLLNVITFIPNKIYQGRLFTITVEEKGEFDLVFNLESNRKGNDSAKLELTNGNFKITLYQPVQTVVIPTNDLSLFEVLYAILREMEFSTAKVSKHPKRQR